MLPEEHTIMEIIRIYPENASKKQVYDLTMNPKN